MTIVSQTSNALLVCCITLAATTVAVTTHATVPGTEPLTVTKLVPSDRAPWPNHTLVLAWMDREGAGRGDVEATPLTPNHIIC